jgi:hypothetical protein
MQQHGGRKAPLTPKARSTDWRTAHRSTFGPGAEDGWLKDLAPLGLEVYTVTGTAMVLVDRDPIRTDAEGNAFVRKGVLDTGAARMDLVQGPDLITESVTHGVYDGRVGGVAVHMDQLVKVRNGVPVGIVRVLQRADRPVKELRLDGIVQRFLGEETSALAS